MSWVALLIIHGLIAFLLLGAVTHQAVSTLWPAPRKRHFIESFAAVRTGFYVNAVIVLFLVNFFFGAWIYTNYRTNARIPLEFGQYWSTVGLFETKEHVISLVGALLPTYWLFWKRVPLTEGRATRSLVTLIVAAGILWVFVAGHIVNNAKGVSV